MSEGIMTGGPIKPFHGGWAKFPFVGNRSHYWVNKDSEYTYAVVGMTLNDHAWESLCNVAGLTTDKAPALEEGNFPRCKKCEKIYKIRRIGQP